MDDLTRLRGATERFLCWYLAAHIPLVALCAAFVAQRGWMMPTLGATLLVGGAILTRTVAPGSFGARGSLSVALMGIIALLVYCFEGHPWQVDLHMYFFAGLALLTPFCDWRALLLSAAAVAVHHLLLNFIYPAAVFPGGGDFARVILHAVIVVIQTGMLVWVSFRLTQAFAHTGDALRAAEEARAAAEHAASERDQSALQSESRRQADLTRLADNFQRDVGRVISNLSAAAGSTRNAAQTMDGLIDDVGQSTGIAAGQAREVTQDVATVAHAAEQLSNSVGEVNRFIQQSSDIAHSAVAEVEKTNSTVEGLVSAAERIGNVVSLIQEIASQTNLLALNATIEAARAGEAGKGFAVVASEVKSLAGQTAKATEDISLQVNAIQSVSASAVAAIRGIGELIGRIETAVSTIASSAATQGGAIGEITRSAHRAAQVTATVSDRLGDVVQATNRLDGLSAERVREANDLAEQADGLSRQVERFAASVRA